jgi:hypothetical protein
LTRFPCVHVTCDIPLENSWWELQLWFRPHLNRRSAHKIMKLQNHGSPNIGNFEIPKSHLDAGLMERCSVYYKGEGGGFPQVRAEMNLVSPSCPWLILAPKVLQLCTNHLVLVLCKSVWIVEACQFFLVPSRSSITSFYPSKVLRAKERASSS